MRVAGEEYANIDWDSVTPSDGWEPILDVASIPFVGRKPPQHAAKGTVYLAGPITGETYEAARFGWRQYVADRLVQGITVLSPMRGDIDGHRDRVGAIRSTYPDQNDKLTFYKDVLDIERADMLLVNLTGATRVSIGTMVEIGLAFAKGKKIITVMESGNPHSDHPFITEPSMMIVSDIDEAIVVINTLLSDGV